MRVQRLRIKPGQSRKYGTFSREPSITRGCRPSTFVQTRGMPHLTQVVCVPEDGAVGPYTARRYGHLNSLYQELTETRLAVSTYNSSSWESAPKTTLKNHGKEADE